MSKWFVPHKNWLFAPTIETDTRFQEASNWAREFMPETDKESYCTALDHAHRKYKLTVDHFDAIDRKTDDLMKTAVTLTALLVGAVKALELELTDWFYVTFACFIASIVLAIISRRPTLPETPGSVREVLSFVEDFRIQDHYQI